jgi:hypothetical protein
LLFSEETDHGIQLLFSEETDHGIQSSANRRTNTFSPPQAQNIAFWKTIAEGVRIYFESVNYLDSTCETLETQPLASTNTSGR